MRQAKPRTNLEPWLASYYKALRRRREPLVYLLVSWEDAIALADGQLPKRLRKQARTLLTWRAPTRTMDVI